MTEEQLKRLPHYVQDEICALKSTIDYYKKKSVGIGTTGDHFFNSSGVYISTIDLEERKTYHLPTSEDSWISVCFGDLYRTVDISYDKNAGSLYIRGKVGFPLKFEPIGRNEISITMEE